MISLCVKDRAALSMVLRDRDVCGTYAECVPSKKNVNKLF